MDFFEKITRRRTARSSAGESSPDEVLAAESLAFPETPFFHFDLPSAVKAAELATVDGSDSIRSSEDDSKSDSKVTT